MENILTLLFILEINIYFLKNIVIALFLCFYLKTIFRAGHCAPHIIPVFQLHTFKTTPAHGKTFLRKQSHRAAAALLLFIVPAAVKGLTVAQDTAAWMTRRATALPGAGDFWAPSRRIFQTVASRNRRNLGEDQKGFSASDFNLGTENCSGQRLWITLMVTLRTEGRGVEPTRHAVVGRAGRALLRGGRGG